MMRETELASKVIKELRTYPKTFVINIAGSQYQQAGLPDCLIISNGVFCFVEFKNPETAVEPLQLRMMDLMRNAGATCCLVRFYGKGEWIINNELCVRFTKFDQGVKALYITLMKIAKGENVIPSSQTPNN